VNVGVIMFAVDTFIIMAGLLLIQDAKLIYSLLIVSIVDLLACIITSFQKVEIFIK
jgi:hypothetical protein